MIDHDRYDDPIAYVRAHLNDPVVPRESYQDRLVDLYQDRPVVLLMPRRRRSVPWPS